MNCAREKERKFQAFLGRLGLVGLVGSPLEEDWVSDWSDWSDWSEVLLREWVLRLVGLVGLVRELPGRGRTGPRTSCLAYSFQFLISL